MPELSLETLGTTGLRHFNGFIDEEFLSRLRGRQAAKLYREMMDNNAIVGSIFYIIKNLIRQVEWRIEPVDESDAAKVEAEFIESALEDMSMTFEDLISESLSMLGFGFAPFEIIYKMRRGPGDDPTTRSDHNDGKVGWRKFEIRSQDTVDKWVFDAEGGIEGLVQHDPHTAGRGPIFIPIEKMLLFRTETSKGNPEGRSLLRPAVTSYHYLKRLQQIEAVGIERDLAGMPIFEVPRELLMVNAAPGDAALRSLLETWIQQIRVDERFGGLVPSELDTEGKPTGFKFKLLSSGGTRAMDTDKIIRRYESRIAMTFLAEFILLGMDKVGSFALVSSKTDLFAVALGALMDNITSVFNRFAIRRLQELNRRPPDLDPKLIHGDIENIALTEIAPFIQALASSGLLSPNKPLERKLLEIADLPLPPEEEESTPAAPASSAGPPPVPGNEPGGNTLPPFPPGSPENPGGGSATGTDGEGT